MPSRPDHHQPANFAEYLSVVSDDDVSGDNEETSSFIHQQAEKRATDATAEQEDNTFPRPRGAAFSSWVATEETTRPQQAPTLAALPRGHSRGSSLSTARFISGTQSLVQTPSLRAFREEEQRASDVPVSGNRRSDSDGCLPRTVSMIRTATTTDFKKRKGSLQAVHDLICKALVVVEDAVAADKESQ